MDTSGLKRVRADIADAVSRSGARADSVELVVVSKGRSTEDVARIVSAGEVVFGENRQQGLAARVESSLPRNIEWHFVGPLQRRKVAFVAKHVALLHSLDRMSLARNWVAAGGTLALVQFNLGSEPQKSGFEPDRADAVLEELLEIGVDVRGVMAIPPQVADAQDARRNFAKLREIYDAYSDGHANMEHCSMGMSADFPIAIEEGSTMVRIGRAIFEPRSR